MFHTSPKPILGRGADPARARRALPAHDGQSAAGDGALQANELHMLHHLRTEHLVDAATSTATATIAGAKAAIRIVFVLR